MIPRELNDITESDVRALIASRREEGRQIDFKRDLPRNDHDGRKDFFADICAFANTAGGDLVYGVREEGGFAVEVAPQAVPDSVDGYVLRLQSSIRDKIEPIVQGVSIRAIPLDEGGYVMVIRVAKSFAGMHRSRDDGHFHIRKSRSNERLDVPGVIAKVAEYLGREDRVRSFFARRYADILSNEHAMHLGDGPKLVVHLIPVRDFIDGTAIDLSFATLGRTVPMLTADGGHTLRNTYDGKSYFQSDQGTATAFTQILHSGVVESCTDLIGRFWPDDAKKISLGYVEECVLRFLETVQQTQFAEATVGFPFMARVALLGANGKPFDSGLRVDVRQYTSHPMVKQPLPVLTLPDVLFEAPGVNVAHEMYPAFLRMWESWGYLRALSYKEVDGVWIRQA